MVGKHLQDALELEDKSTYSDKIYNTGAVLSSSISVIMLITCVIAFIANSNTGLLFWQYLFYPMLVFNISGIYLSIAQVLRNRYFSIILSSTLSVITFLAIVVIIILQIVIYHKVWIVPFVFF